MGNLRSVEKALEHVGAAPEVTSDHERVRAADGVVLPGVGAFPKAMEAVRRLGLDELLHERVGRRRAGARASAWACSCCSSRTTELGGAEGLGLLEGTVEALDAPGLKVPQIGWNPVSWRREIAAQRGACPSPAPSTTCTRSRRGPPARPTCSAPPATAPSS